MFAISDYSYQSPSPWLVSIGKAQHCESGRRFSDRYVSQTILHPISHVRDHIMKLQDRIFWLASSGVVVILRQVTKNLQRFWWSTNFRMRLHSKHFIQGFDSESGTPCIAGLLQLRGHRSDEQIVTTVKWLSQSIRGMPQCIRPSTLLSFYDHHRGPIKISTWTSRIWGSSTATIRRIEL